jgi:hypothetical protein
MPKGQRSLNAFIGQTPKDNNLGVKRSSAIQISNIPSAGLITHLDAGNPLSYPGSGTVWYDLSPSGYNYNILEAAYFDSKPGHMSFNGLYGIAKSVITTEVSAPSAYTLVVWTRVKPSTADWRTLYRPYANDHTVICSAGSWDVGMYDNEASGFLTSSFSQQNFPGGVLGETWFCMYVRVQNTSPQWRMSYNDTPGTIRGSISNANAYTSRLLGNLGGWGNGDAVPSNASQFWGDISAFYLYNRILTDTELLQIFNNTRSRYGV